MAQDTVTKAIPAHAIGSMVGLNDSKSFAEVLGFDPKHRTYWLRIAPTGKYLITTEDNVRTLT